MTTCKHCNGTGDMTGNGYLDCTHCDAAEERAALEAWAKSAGIALTAALWTIYQHGKAAAIAELVGAA